MEYYLPPSFISAVAWTASFSLRTKHWYIPRSSLLTDEILICSLVISRTRDPVRSGWPSFSHQTVDLGNPLILHSNSVGLPRSMVWRAGWMCTVNGAVTSRWSSSCSVPSELAHVHTYCPASDCCTDVKRSVPSSTDTRCRWPDLPMPLVVWWWLLYEDDEDTEADDELPEFGPVTFGMGSSRPNRRTCQLMNL